MIALTFVIIGVLSIQDPYIILMMDTSVNLHTFFESSGNGIAYSGSLQIRFKQLNKRLYVSFRQGPAIADVDGQWKGPVGKVKDGVVDCKFGSGGLCNLRFPTLGVPCFPGYGCVRIPGTDTGECCKLDDHECPFGQDGVCGIIGDVGFHCQPGTRCVKAKCCIDTCPNGQNGTCNIFDGPSCAEGTKCYFGDTPDAVGKCCVKND